MTWERRHAPKITYIFKVTCYAKDEPQVSAKNHLIYPRVLILGWFGNVSAGK